MASKQQDDKAENHKAQDAKPADIRHIYGPRQVCALIPALVRPAFRRRAPATAQVLADWEVIVGPAIAAVTMPRKLFAGTLSIGCTGPMAMELQHLSEQLIGRINAHLGRVTVTRLRFVQDIPPAAAAAPATPPAGGAGGAEGGGAFAPGRVARCPRSARPGGLDAPARVIPTAAATGFPTHLSTHPVHTG